MWTGEPPYRALGRSAVGTAAKDFALGNAGAGLGAKAGRLKGGIGSASLVLADGATVGAIVAVNSCGSAVRPDCGRFWAADLALPGEIDPQPAAPRYAASTRRISRNARRSSPAPTRRSRSSPPMRRSTRAAAGVWRSWRRTGSPARSARSTPRSTATPCSRWRPEPARRPHPRYCCQLGNAAADCLARAVMRALTMAEPLGGVPSWRQLWRRPPGAA